VRRTSSVRSLFVTSKRLTMWGVGSEPGVSWIVGSVSSIFSISGAPTLVKRQAMLPHKKHLRRLRAPPVARSNRALGVIEVRDEQWRRLSGVCREVLRGDYMYKGSMTAWSFRWQARDCCARAPTDNRSTRMLSQPTFSSTTSTYKLENMVKCAL
jgi:hypothetical protein